ncbi:MAG: nitroreductase family protein, partial [Candidatus Woesearchaeota archaeon]
MKLSSIHFKKQLLIRIYGETMEFHEIIQQRWATKSFTDKKVSDELITTLKTYIQLSASSFGLQPYTIYVIDNKEVQQQLQDASYNQPQVGSASHVFVFCANTHVQQRIEEYKTLMEQQGIAQQKIDGYMNVLKGWSSHLDAQLTKAWAQKQVYLAVANAINGAKALGFDSCPMEGFDASAYT